MIYLDDVSTSTTWNPLLTLVLIVIWGLVVWAVAVLWRRYRSR